MSQTPKAPDELPETFEAKVIAQLTRQTCLNITTPHIQRMSHLFEIMACGVHIFKICDGYAVMLYLEPFWHVCRVTVYLIQKDTKGKKPKNQRGVLGK